MAGAQFITDLLAADPRADKRAVALYRKAIRRAQRRCKKSDLSENDSDWLGADAVAEQLEWLLRGACYFVDCRDGAAYQRLNQAILNWQPATTDQRVLIACGMVQNGLLSLLPQLQQKQRLEHLCEQYEIHLARAASEEAQTSPPPSPEHLAASMDLPLSVQALVTHSRSPSPAVSEFGAVSDSLYLIQEKQASVNRMRQVWTTRQDLSTQYRNFQTAFQQERRVLEKDRDSKTMIFVKAVLTILSFGLAAICGIWSIKGEQMGKQIDQVLETPGPGMC
jgi:hypothetical protein